MAVRRMPCRIDGAFFLPASRHQHRQRQTPDGAGALYEADYSANRRRERIDAKARTSGRDIRGPSLKQPLRSSLPTSQGQIYRAVLDFPPHLRSRNPGAETLYPDSPDHCRQASTASRTGPYRSFAERKRRDRQPDNPEIQSGGKATPQSMLQSFARICIRDSVTRYERSYR